MVVVGAMVAIGVEQRVGPRNEVNNPVTAALQAPATREIYRVETGLASLHQQFDTWRG